MYQVSSRILKASEFQHLHHILSNKRAHRTTTSQPPHQSGDLPGPQSDPPPSHPLPFGSEFIRNENSRHWPKPLLPASTCDQKKRMTGPSPTLAKKPSTIYRIFKGRVWISTCIVLSISPFVHPSLGKPTSGGNQTIHTCSGSK